MSCRSGPVGIVKINRAALALLEQCQGQSGRSIHHAMNMPSYLGHKSEVQVL
ncbi:hypothetical protein AFAE65S_03852 [Alcaligenes phenolicus]